MTQDQNLLPAVAEGVESRGDRSALTVAIEPNRPWSQWESPDSVACDLPSLRVRAIGERLSLFDEEGTGEELGPLSEEALRNLAFFTQFDPKFIREKLSPETAAIVINERIDRAPDYRNHGLSILRQGEKVLGITAGWKEVVPARVVAQRAFDLLRQSAPEARIAYAALDPLGMRIDLLTEVSEPVTRALDDVLEKGISVTQDYADRIQVSAYTRRLVCLNGATAVRIGYSWQSRQQGSQESQLLWLSDGIAKALGAYEGIVEHARTMAETRYDGDPHRVLDAHARAMHLPRRHLSALHDAFDSEPGPTMWNIQNAFTRLATHGGLPRSTRRALEYTAGEWVRSFETVTARLPRPLALSVGAEILPEPVREAGLEPVA